MVFAPREFPQAKNSCKSDVSQNKNIKNSWFIVWWNSKWQETLGKSEINNEKSLKTERFPLPFEVGISGNMGKKSKDLNPKP